MNKTNLVFSEESDWDTNSSIESDSEKDAKIKKQNVAPKMSSAKPASDACDKVLEQEKKEVSALEGNMPKNNLEATHSDGPTSDLKIEVPIKTVNKKQEITNNDSNATSSDVSKVSEVLETKIKTVKTKKKSKADKEDQASEDSSSEKKSSIKKIKKKKERNTKKDEDQTLEENKLLTSISSAASRDATTKEKSMEVKSGSRKKLSADGAEDETKLQLHSDSEVKIIKIKKKKLKPKDEGQESPSSENKLKETSENVSSTRLEAVQSRTEKLKDIITHSNIDTSQVVEDVKRDMRVADEKTTEEKNNPTKNSTDENVEVEVKPQPFGDSEVKTVIKIKKKKLKPKDENKETPRVASENKTKEASKNILKTSTEVVPDRIEELKDTVANSSIEMPQADDKEDIKKDQLKGEIAQHHDSSETGNICKIFTGGRIDHESDKLQEEIPASDVKLNGQPSETDSVNTVYDEFEYEEFIRKIKERFQLDEEPDHLTENHKVDEIIDQEPIQDNLFEREPTKHELFEQEPAKIEQKPTKDTIVEDQDDKSEVIFDSLLKWNSEQDDITKKFDKLIHDSIRSDKSTFKKEPTIKNQSIDNKLQYDDENIGDIKYSTSKFSKVPSNFETSTDSKKKVLREKMSQLNDYSGESDEDSEFYRNTFNADKSKDYHQSPEQSRAREEGFMARFRRERNFKVAPYKHDTMFQPRRREDTDEKVREKTKHVRALIDKQLTVVDNLRLSIQKFSELESVIKEARAESLDQKAEMENLDNLFDLAYKKYENELYTAVNQLKLQKKTKTKKDDMDDILESFLGDLHKPNIGKQSIVSKTLRDLGKNVADKKLDDNFSEIFPSKLPSEENLDFMMNLFKKKLWSNFEDVERSTAEDKDYKKSFFKNDVSDSVNNTHNENQNDSKETDITSLSANEFVNRIRNKYAIPECKQGTANWKKQSKSIESLTYKDKPEKISYEDLLQPKKKQFRNWIDLSKERLNFSDSLDDNEGIHPGLSTIRRPERNEKCLNQFHYTKSAANRYSNPSLNYVSHDFKY